MRCLAVIPLLIAIAVAPAAAQGLRGRLLDVDSVTPVGGALVLLQDSAGLTIDKGVSNEGGRFQLRAPVAGVYALRVLRIGYAPWQTLVALSAGQTLDRSLLLGDARIALPEIRVEGTQLCGARAAGDSLGSVLWAQAGTALSLANEAIRTHQYRFGTTMEDRLVDSTGMLSRSLPTSSLTSLSTSWPIKSLPPDSLLRYGFILNREDLVDGPTWFGPDADFLLSESFLASHCFRTVPPGAGLPAEWVGLAFEPASKRDLSDVRGTLWLDRTSARLRRIDYRYTELPSWAHGRDAQGALTFATLSDGGWVVQQWFMRVPVPKVNAATRQAGFFGYREWGGQVTEVLSPSGAVIQRFPR